MPPVGPPAVGGTFREQNRAAGRALRAWGVLCAVPAVLASTCLVTILFSGLGRWTLPAVGGWLLGGPLLLLGPAERVAVRALCRFRIPTGPRRSG